MNTSESDDSAAWQIVRELVDNHLEPASEGFDEFSQAQWLMHTGKYSAAEPLFQSSIRKLRKARERLDEEGMSLISNLGRSDVALQKVLDFARLEIDEDIESAESGYQVVRQEREKGRDEIPAEERYNKILKLKRAHLTVFWVYSSCIILVSLGLGVLAYHMSPWLVLLPTAVCVIAGFVVYLRMAFAIEHLIHVGDTEMQEFAKRDGWWS